MPYYENVFIARQEISTQQVDAIADVFSEIIKDGGGKVTKRENWGLKTLAYRIKKSRKAHYILFNIDAPADVVHEMERQMGLNEDVLRHLTIRLDELSDEPSVQAQVKTNRSHEDRDSGEFKARVPEKQAPDEPAEDLSIEKSDSGPIIDPESIGTDQPSSDPDILDNTTEQESGKNDPTE